MLNSPFSFLSYTDKKKAAAMEMTNVGNLLELRRIYSRGITGKGITTAVLDTGIYAHPDFLFHRIKFFIFRIL